MPENSEDIIMRRLVVGNREENEIDIKSFLGQALLNNPINDGDTISYSPGNDVYTYRIISTADTLKDLQTKVKSKSKSLGSCIPDPTTQS